INIFQWCDNQYNFIGMCHSIKFESGEKDYTVEYTLEELPDAIDNAEIWLKSIKEKSEFSGSPYFISSLQIMSV
ncbi:hypothetical protein, partial [Legionella donaldsonii]|uniref:hypothetical protein n=1 Tax=Legionella donaldsonii TaxID=45060 RepID=UPI00399D4E73